MLVEDAAPPDTAPDHEKRTFMLLTLSIKK